MKKIAFIFLFFLPLFALQNEDLKSVWQDSVRVKFTLTKELKGFEKKLVSFGEFYMKEKELFYIIKSPIKSVMKINEEGVFYEENGKFLKSVDNYDKGLFLALINLDFNELEKNFNAQLSGQQDKWELLLEPKNMWLKKIFKQILVKGSEKIQSIELLESNGDLSLYEILP